MKLMDLKYRHMKRYSCVHIVEEITALLKNVLNVAHILQINLLKRHPAGSAMSAIH